MDDFEDCALVFGADFDKPYQKEVVDEIIRYRQDLEDQLFIDRLLAALGIDDASRLYPPKSGLELRKLHECITGCASPDHHKLAVLYYIRKDFPTPSRQAAEKLARTFYLPEKYRIFVDGLWFLDRLRLESALEYLTEPTLIPTYPEEILYTLCRHAPENDPSLPLAYYHTVSPGLSSGKVLEALFLVLCRSSLAEAFYFSRTQDEATHHKLFQKLVSFVHAGSKDGSKAMRGATLISLPLNEVEETWLNEYLKDGEGRKLRGASDTIIMRGLIKGDLGFLENNSEDFSVEKINGVNWSHLKDGLHRGLKS